MDDPDPSPALAWALFQTTEPGSLSPIVSGLLASILALVAAIYRHAVREASRTRILENARSEAKEKLERAIEREESIDAALGLLQFLGEIWFVLALNQALSQELFGTPGSATRINWTLLLSIVWLFPLVHALPPGIATRYAESLARPALPTLAMLSLVFSPVTAPLLKLRHGRRSQTNGEADDKEKEHLTGEIIDAVEESERAGALEESEAEMIERVLSFQDLHVSEVMTPRTDLTSIAIEATVEEALELAHKEGHSKIPVFRKNRDEICGLFHLRDAIPHLSKRDTPLPPLEKLLRKPYFVPETKGVGQLLREFQAETQSVAIVLDEYGGTAGIITAEDIVEEIVGDLREEHDIEETTPIQKTGADVFSVDPRVRIEDANEELEIHLPPSEDYDTVGGFVFSHLDRIPDAGEKFEYEGTEFRVLEVDSRRILRLELRTHVEQSGDAA